MSGIRSTRTGIVGFVVMIEWLFPGGQGPSGGAQGLLPAVLENPAVPGLGLDLLHSEPALSPQLSLWVYLGLFWAFVWRSYSGLTHGSGLKGPCWQYSEDPVGYQE